MGRELGRVPHADRSILAHLSSPALSLRPPPLADFSEFLDFGDDPDLVFDLPLCSPLPTRRSSSLSSFSSTSPSSDTFSPLSVMDRSLPPGASSPKRDHNDRFSSPPVPFPTRGPDPSNAQTSLFPELDALLAHEDLLSSHVSETALDFGGDGAFVGLMDWWKTSGPVDAADTTNTEKWPGMLISEATPISTHSGHSVPSHSVIDLVPLAHTTVARPVAGLPKRAAPLRPRPTFIHLPASNHRQKPAALEHGPPIPLGDFAAATDQIWDQKRKRFDLVLPTFARCSK